MRFKRPRRQRVTNSGASSSGSVIQKNKKLGQFFGNDDRQPIELVAADHRFFID
jgi:hypothetical protein